MSPIPDVAVNSPNVLSYQSAFWALVTIALNTMSQPSGRIITFRSSWNFALRSSPLVCAVNASYTLSRLGVLVYRTGSMRDTMQDLVEERFSDQDSRDGSIASLRKKAFFRILLFVIGALPQAIKIYTTRGAVWTQILCSAFLFAFIVDEILLSMTLSQPDASSSNEDIPNPICDHQGFGLVIHASMAITYGYCAYTIHSSNACRAPKDIQYPIFDISLEILITFTSIIILLSPLSLAVYSKRIERLGSTFLAFLPLGFYGGLVIIQLLDVSVPLAWRKNVMALISLGVYMVLLRNLLAVTTLMVATILRVVFGTYFVLLHLLAAIIYYTAAYDSSTTHRPKWTALLG